MLAVKPWAVHWKRAACGVRIAANCLAHGKAADSWWSPFLREILLRLVSRALVNLHIIAEVVRQTRRFRIPEKVCVGLVNISRIGHTSSTPIGPRGLVTVIRV